MRPWLVLPLQVKVDLEVMAMKRYSTFPKALELEPYHQMVSCHTQDTQLGSVLPPVQLVYSTAPDD